MDYNAGETNRQICGQGRQYPMEGMIGLLGINLLALVVLMTFGWIVSLPIRNVTVVDSLWGLGFVLTAWLSFFIVDEGYAGRQWLVTLLTTFWGLRLSIYLSIRNWGQGEDPRYAKWRIASGTKFWRISLFKVFWLQALFLWVIALVIQVPQPASQPDYLTLWDGIGTGVWLVGFVLESIADRQLQRFKANPHNKGKVFNQGLWRYSRHPNYFGEFLIWWGLFLIACNVPHGWWTIISPIVMTVVLTKMTGIPLTEASIMKARPGYRDYIARTNSFIPWFPKRSSHE